MDYILPIASQTTLGGIKIGAGLTILDNGTVNVTNNPVADGSYQDIIVSSNGTIYTIASNVVTNAKLYQMPAGTIKANITGAPAQPADVTLSQLTSNLSVFTGDSGSGGVKGLVPAPAAGDGNAGKYLKADGTWSVPAGGGGGGFIQSVDDTSTINLSVVGNELTADFASMDISQFTNDAGYITSSTTPTLQDVTNTGNTTTNDIEFGPNAGVYFDNGSRVVEGTVNANLGGHKGVALKCSVDYELKWEAGRLYVMEQNGTTIREVAYNFNNLPTVTDDFTKGFVVGSRWTLDNGTAFICTNATPGIAVWQLQAFVPYTGATADVDLGNFSENAKSFHVKGTAGAGHIGLKHQSADATAGGNESSLWADNSGNINWKIANTYKISLNSSSNTANRSYTLPNNSGTFALTSQLLTFGDFGALAPLGYDGSGGFTISQASSSSDGYLSQADWSSFTNKSNATELLQVITTHPENSVACDKIFLADANSGGFDITPNPVLALTRRTMTVIKTDKSTNQVKVYPTTGCKFNNGLTNDPLILANQFDTATIYFDQLGLSVINYTLQHFPLKTKLIAAGSFKVPNGYMIQNIIAQEITGTPINIKFGTTLGGADVVASLNLTTTDPVYVTDADLLKRIFNTVATPGDQIIYVDEILGSWPSGAEVQLSVELKQIM